MKSYSEIKPICGSVFNVMWTHPQDIETHNYQMCNNTSVKEPSLNEYLAKGWELIQIIEVPGQCFKLENNPEYTKHSEGFSTRLTIDPTRTNVGLIYIIGKPRE